MATPTEKNPPIESLFNAVFGIDRTASIEADTCGGCGGPAEQFKDELSMREYEISALCQLCQDAIFEDPIEDCVGAGLDEIEE